jgi:hypothetical protein
MDNFNWTSFAIGAGSAVVICYLYDLWRQEQERNQISGYAAVARAMGGGDPRG